MSQTDPNSDDSELGCLFQGPSRKHEFRFPVWLVTHLSIEPGDALHPSSPDGLKQRFLGGKARSVMLKLVGPLVAVSNLSCTERPLAQLISLSLQSGL